MSEYSHDIRELPKWAKEFMDKEYQHQNGIEIFKDLNKSLAALSIAWEALRKIGDQDLDEMNETNQEIACEARLRIEELGK